MLAVVLAFVLVYSMFQNLVGPLIVKRLSIYLSEQQLELTLTDYTFPAATATQSVLTLLLERILLDPQIQDKIHEEIDRVVGRDRLPTLDDRQKYKDLFLLDNFSRVEF